jgi:DNA-directed RNA polymerase, mitochondrial
MPTGIGAALERAAAKKGVSFEAVGLGITGEARNRAREYSQILAIAIGKYRARNPGGATHPLVCKLLGAGEDGVTCIPPGSSLSEPLMLGYVPDELVADTLIQAGYSAICMRDRTDEPMTYLRMSLRVARALQWECFAAALRRSIGMHTKNVEAKIKKLATDLHGISRRPAFAKWYAKQANVEVPDLNPAEAHQFGAWAMDMLAVHLPELFKWGEATRKVWVKEKKRRFLITEYLLRLQPGASKLMPAVFEDHVRRNPGIFPCPQPPKDWTSVADGGVWTNEAMPQPLVRTDHAKVLHAVQNAIDRRRMRPVLNAVNALQRVPLAINEDVLKCVQRTYQPPPNDEAAFEFDMTAATGALERDRFWLSYSLDSRGRLYALSNFNYACEDRVRALFRFAEGKPIGQCGMYWLKCHLAACADGLGLGGVPKPSKLDFDARVAWADTHARDLRDIGLAAVGPDPAALVGHLKKLEKKKPYQFIAAAIELARVLDCGPGYESRLPVQFDQSSSGPQHLVLLTRDLEAAPIVGLKLGHPHDLYEEIALRVREAIYADPGPLGSARPSKIVVEAGDVFDASAYGSRAGLDFERMVVDAVDGQFVRDLIDDDGRGVVKIGGGMTFFYNSQTGGMADRILEKRPHLSIRAATYIAKMIYKITPEVLPGPAGVLRRLKALVSIFNRRGETFRWYTPNGLPVLNLHLKPRTQTITTYRHVDEIAKPRQTEVADGYTDEIDADDAIDAVTANFIHSLDGCLLQRIAVRCEAAGIPLLTVHDCFAALAADAEQLRGILFDELAKLYHGRDILREVWEQAEKDLPAGTRLPKRPPYGDLKVESGRDITDKAFA